MLLRITVRHVAFGIAVAITLAACKAPAPALPGPDGAPIAVDPAAGTTAEAAGPLGDPDASQALTETARTGHGQTAVTTSGSAAMIGPVSPLPTSDARASGVAALVNLDVKNNCSHGIAPGAFGLRFTLFPITPESPEPRPTDVTKVVADLWNGTGDPKVHAQVYLNDDNPPRTVIKWPVQVDYDNYVPFDAVAHVGYRLNGDPTHVSRVEYLFGTLSGELAPVQDCVAAELSTSWYAASTTLGYADPNQVPVVFPSQSQSPAGRGTFSIAQLQPRRSPRVDVQYVTTAHDIDVTQLVTGSPLFASGVVTAHVGVEMPADRLLETTIPWSAGDRWALVIATWRDVTDGVTAREPYLVAYYGYPLGLRTSPEMPPGRTN